MWCVAQVICLVRYDITNVAHIMHHIVMHYFILTDNECEKTVYGILYK